LAFQRKRLGVGRASSPGQVGTSEALIQGRYHAGIAVSRDGRGRALDNVFVQRRWRNVKYEDIDIKDYEAVPELESGLAPYFRFYD
jgi:putative transposase